MAHLAAIVLAAGASERFGADNKLLARIGGRALVLGVAEQVLDSGVTDVLAVTGCEAPRIEQALAGLAVRCVRNVAWQAGMGSSIACGIKALKDGCAGAFIVPGDMPRLRADLLRSLVTVFEHAGATTIVYPATPDGAQRNPVLWPRRFFPELAALTGAAGAKALLQCHADASLPVKVESASIFADVDTPADLAALDPSPGAR